LKPRLRYRLICGADDLMGRPTHFRSKIGCWIRSNSCRPSMCYLTRGRTSFNTLDFFNFPGENCPVHLPDHLPPECLRFIKSALYRKLSGFRQDDEVLHSVPGRRSRECNNFTKIQDCWIILRMPTRKTCTVDQALWISISFGGQYGQKECRLKAPTLSTRVPGFPEYPAGDYGARPL